MIYFVANTRGASSSKNKTKISTGCAGYSAATDRRKDRVRRNSSRECKDGEVLQRARVRNSTCPRGCSRALCAQMLNCIFRFLLPIGSGAVLFTVFSLCAVLKGGTAGKHGAASIAWLPAMFLSPPSPHIIFSNHRLFQLVHAIRTPLRTAAFRSP